MLKEKEYNKHAYKETACVYHYLASSYWLLHTISFIFVYDYGISV